MPLYNVWTHELWERRYRVWADGEEDAIDLVKIGAVDPESGENDFNWIDDMPTTFWDVEELESEESEGE